MNQHSMILPHNRTATGHLRAHVSGAARIHILLLVAGFVVVAMAAGFLRLRRGEDAARSGPGEMVSDTAGLSAVTLKVLNGLRAPVEIRFYNFLDGNRSVASPAFARQLDDLLSAYAAEADGKIRITRHPASADGRTSARADGLEPLPAGGDGPGYFGIAVIGTGGKATIPRIVQEWGHAVEVDLTRAIQRVGYLGQPQQAVVNMSDLNPTAVEGVRQRIPNLSEVSIEEGTRILREASIEEFSQAAREMETRIKAAQSELGKALHGGSESAQQVARQRLREIQTEHTRELQTIARRLQDQIEALEGLKGLPPRSAP